MAGCWKTRPVDHSTFHLRSAISRRWCLMSFLLLPSFSRTHTHTQNTYKHRHTWTHARIVVCWLFMVTDSLRLLFISCSHQSPESCPAFRLFHCSPVHFIILSSVILFLNALQFVSLVLVVVFCGFIHVISWADCEFLNDAGSQSLFHTFLLNPPTIWNANSYTLKQIWSSR